MKLLKRGALFLLLWHNYKKASNRKWCSERWRQDHKFNLKNVISNVNVLLVIVPALFVLSFKWIRSPLAADICLLITSSSSSRRLIGLQRWQKIAVWFAVIGSFLSVCLFLTWYKHGTSNFHESYTADMEHEQKIWSCFQLSGCPGLTGFVWIVPPHVPLVV